MGSPDAFTFEVAVAFVEVIVKVECGVEGKSGVHIEAVPIAEVVVDVDVEAKAGV